MTLLASLSAIAFLSLVEKIDVSDNFKIIVLGSIGSSYLLVISGFIIRIYEQTKNRPTFVIRESVALKNRK